MTSSPHPVYVDFKINGPDIAMTSSDKTDYVTDYAVNRLKNKLTV